MRKIISILAIWAIYLPGIAFGQRSNTSSYDVKKIMQEMKSSRNMSYKYSMTAEYPNGEKDHVDGTAYMGNDNKLMYNDNDAMTTIYDGNWYYRADHREKTIALLNVSKYLTDSYRKALEKDMFENNALGIYLDSVIVKYGKVKKMTRTGDTMFLELRFPANMYITDIDIVFNEKTKMMVRYVTRTFQPWKGREYGSGKGTSQVISCQDFRKAESGAYSIERFFKVSENKVILRKYNKYTLTSKL